MVIKVKNLFTMIGFYYRKHSKYLYPRVFTKKDFPDGQTYYLCRILNKYDLSIPRECIDDLASLGAGMKTEKDILKKFKEKTPDPYNENRKARDSQ